MQINTQALHRLRYKIWVRKETCSHTFADLTYKYSSCYSSPVTSGSFVEPLRQLWTVFPTGQADGRPAYRP